MYINAIGHYIPTGRITNEYFKDLNGLDPEWIVQRTGIETRSRCGKDENVDTMAIEAIENTLAALPYPIKEVDLVVAAHYCAYDTVGTVAHKVQRKYGIEGAKAVYASSACSSFVNGLEIIEGYFAMGKAKRALLICSEQNSYYSNDHDAKAGHLWGDAAVAYFISKERESEKDIEILSVFTESLGHLGKGPEGVMLRPKENGIEMPDGRDVFLYAVKYMEYALMKNLEASCLNKEDVRYFITHQANMRIVKQLARMIEVPMERFLNNIQELGNTGSASAALVLSQNLHKLHKGDIVSLMVFGGGYSCAAFTVKI
ncbi:MAG: ketoacyl-ACP synthase III [Muribaculaceae bacterium]|nr:ketoacyl-ACP synthase III [Lachnospiraceae bacterium]MCM1294822.1 ketoacyl-ACP synthase III [Muribaculaceae bacterium]